MIAVPRENQDPRRHARADPRAKIAARNCNVGRRQTERMRMHPTHTKMIGLDAMNNALILHLL